MRVLRPKIGDIGYSPQVADKPLMMNASW